MPGWNDVIGEIAPWRIEARAAPSAGLRPAAVYGKFATLPHRWFDRLTNERTSSS
jgi:hypothetical protein